MQNRFVKALLSEIKNQHMQAKIRTLRSKFPHSSKEQFKAQLVQPTNPDEEIPIDDALLDSLFLNLIDLEEDIRTIAPPSGGN